MIQLTLINNSDARIPRKFLQKWIAQIDKLAAKSIDAKRYRNRELVIAFLNKPQARELNQRFRGKDYATDVLSFEGQEKNQIGELVICPQVIRKQAAEHGLTQQEELGYMVLHGFLHLLGYDHETNAEDAQKMFALQDALFEKLRKASR